jgi:aminopeptidase N
MKKFFIAVCLICFSIFVEGQRNIDVLHYRYEIELNDNNDSIKGFATIKFKVLNTTDVLKFDLTDIRGETKGMLATDAYFHLHFPKPLKLSQNNNLLLISSGINLRTGDTMELFIYYKGIPADGLIISKNKYGNRTFFSDNWPNRAHNWIPCVDDPADKATVEFIVTAPSHYQVISNGVQIEETNLPDNKKLTHWKEDVPLPTKVMVIGVADFAVNNIGDVNCVPVSSWVYPENKKEGFGDYAPAKEILNWYMSYIGPYAYKKLANVQSKTTFGGMENASAIFYYENSVTGKQQEEALIAHELVHQWFGNHATEKSFAHLWLSEGFATYLTHVYLESKYGTDSLHKRMQKERREVIDFVKAEKKPVVDTTKDYMSLLNANSYQKGGWILHMLRRELGDSVFKKSVREYYANYAGKNADTKDLQKVFENVSRKNLEQFFKQWLYTGENPKLEISWKYVEKGQQLSITVKQLQKTVFNFPLQVLVGISAGNSKPQIKDLRITKQVETFLIPVGRKAYLLSTGVDPFTSLLCEYTLNEIK